VCQICAKDREPAVRDYPTFLECEIPSPRTGVTGADAGSALCIEMCCGARSPCAVGSGESQTQEMIRRVFERSAKIGLVRQWKGRDSNPRPRHYECVSCRLTTPSRSIRLSNHARGGGALFRYLTRRLEILGR
jgi:hypothetical protein